MSTGSLGKPSSQIQTAATMIRRCNMRTTSLAPPRNTQRGLHMVIVKDRAFKRNIGLTSFKKISLRSNSSCTVVTEKAADGMLRDIRTTSTFVPPTRSPR
ncbi:hypothetical protein PROFUN_08004 [Planoprotostelium fungivorum]|uniref:Uncharacterized protein n=1 Tax=Planoprotostelium fungivorum TaxID=1890364 RepID=A0A2P6MV92_9EUKA|nr:hypothetical protein PROFUN_08004 [Planoprotostelium fungivorum]